MTALIVAACWLALDAVVLAVYGRAAHRRRVVLTARATYSAQALDDARARLAARHNADLWQPTGGAA